MMLGYPLAKLHRLQRASLKLKRRVELAGAGVVCPLIYRLTRRNNNSGSFPIGTWHSCTHLHWSTKGIFQYRFAALGEYGSLRVSNQCQVAVTPEAFSLNIESGESYTKRYC